MGCCGKTQAFNRAPSTGAVDAWGVRALGKRRRPVIANQFTPNRFVRSVGATGATGASGPSSGAIPGFLKPYLNPLLSMIPSLAAMVPPEVATPALAPTPYSIEHFASFQPTLLAIANELGAAHAALESAYRVRAAEAQDSKGAPIPPMFTPALAAIEVAEARLAHTLGARLDMLLQAVTQAAPGPAYGYPTPHTAARWLSDLLRKYGHDHAADVVDRVLQLASQTPPPALMANTGVVRAIGKAKSGLPTPPVPGPFQMIGPFPIPVPGCETFMQRLQDATALGRPQIILDSLLKQYNNCVAAGGMDENLWGAPVNKDQVTPNRIGPALYGMVLTEGMNLREAASPNTQFLTTLSRGTQFEVLAQSIPEIGIADTPGKNRWMRIRTVMPMIRADGTTVMQAVVGFLRAVGPNGELNVLVGPRGLVPGP